MYARDTTAETVQKENNYVQDAVIYRLNLTGIDALCFK